jgi:hypothetical protein
MNLLQAKGKNNLKKGNLGQKGSKLEENKFLYIDTL